MRRQRRPEGQIRQRNPGSFEIRYSLGRDPITGKWKTGTKTVRGTLADAKAERARLLKERHSGEHVETARITVAEWLGQWLEIIKPEISPKTHERYGELVHTYLIPAFGTAQLGKLAPSAIQKVYSEWAAGGRRDGRDGGLAPQTSGTFTASYVLPWPALASFKCWAVTSPMLSKSGCRKSSARKC